MLSLPLLESILNSSPSGHYLLSPSTDPTILLVNDTFLNTVSRTREELVGEKLFAAFPGDPNNINNGTDVLRSSLLKVIESGKPDHIRLQSYPIKVISNDGVVRYEERFWSAVNTPIFDDQNRLLYISHHTTDVTETVQAERQLLKTQLRYRKLTDSIDEGFCIIELIFNEQNQPADYIFREVNPMFEIQTGLQNVIGKSMRELAPHHEDHWFEIYGNVAKTGTPIRFENEAKALYRWYDVYAYSVDDVGSNMVGVIFRDITLRKGHEEALRLSELRLKTLIKATAEIVYRMSPDWSQVYQLEGRGFVKEIDHHHTNKLWLDRYIPIEDQELLHKTIEKAILAKATFELEHRVYMGDGSIGWVESRAVPMLDSSGEIQEWVGAAMDITQRKSTEEELRKIGRRKDDFLAMLAHELRNPLAPISSAAALLGFANLDEVKLKQTSEVITRQVQHMTGLIDDLLDVSRVTKGLITLENTQLDFNKIIADSIEQVKPLIESKKHHLSVKTPTQPIIVMGDHKRLVQVFSNLLNNAAKYTPDGGSLSLNVEVNGNLVNTTVADNGIGMDTEMVQQAFELFTQAIRTSDRSQGGLGIGLALVKSLVELHGGSAEMFSEGMNKGTRATISLPLNGHVEMPSEPVTSIVNKSNDSSLKIMVVDDNVDAAETLCMLLEMLGHEVMTEHNPRTALEHAKVEKPNVCLLDIGLPGMDGNELARHLRAMPETANATIIAITGYGLEQIKLSEGFNHYFVKPIETEKLIELLGNIQKS